MKTSDTKLRCGSRWWSAPVCWQ